MSYPESYPEVMVTLVVYFVFCFLIALATKKRSQQKVVPQKPHVSFAEFCRERKARDKPKIEDASASSRSE